MFISRDSYAEDKISPTILSIAKQRNGPTGMVELQFRKEVMRFEQTFSGQAAPPIAAT